MKVLVVVRHPVGGIRTWMRQVYSKPEFRDFELHILGADCDDLVGLRADLREARVEVVGVHGEDTGLLRESARRLLSGHWDLVHSHGFTAAGLVALAALVSRVPHVTTLHDVILDTQLRGMRGLIRRVGLSAAFRQVDCIQSVSHAAHDNVIEMLRLPPSVRKKMRVIRNGIDVQELREVDSPELHSLYGVDKDRFLIGFFGRFMSQKGFRYLVDAVEMLLKEGSSRRPLVVALGSGGFRTRELREIQSRGLSEYFRIEDSVPRVGGWMRAVDIVAMPSLWEACGLVAMEAMVLGTPLLCSDLPALRELTRGSPAVLVEPANAKALADAIIDLMQNTRKREAAEFADAAGDIFSVAATARGVAHMYREVGSH